MNTNKDWIRVGIVLMGMVLIVLLVLSQQQVREVRGKFAPLPLQTAGLTEQQQQLQAVVLAHPEVRDVLGLGRAEAFSIVPAGDQFPAEAAACKTGNCYQVQTYNYDRNLTVTSLIDADTEALVAVYPQPGIQPHLSPVVSDRALEMVIKHPDVIDALGFQPQQADMMPVNSGLDGSSCDDGHYCVAATFELGERNLFAVFDLTTEELAGMHWETLQPEFENGSQLFDSAECPESGSAAQDGWQVNYETTPTDGLHVYDVAYMGEPVLTSATNVQWAVSYGPSGFIDAVGCGGVITGGGIVIRPYGETAVVPMPDGDGFELVQDFRMANWGDNCNYRYEQRYQFYDDGRFRVVVGAYGRGCGLATYRPVIRMDLAVGNDAENFVARRTDAGWETQFVESWWLQSDAPTGYEALITNADGSGYLLEPGRGQFGDLGRGDDAFLYFTQYKPEEGGTDLGVFPCCADDYQQGPHQFVDGESLVGQNLVIWYVPQMANDLSTDPPYCWTVVGEPNPETYPCFAGPMFVPYQVQPIWYLPLITWGSE